MTLAYEALRQVTPTAAVVLADNPSAMTLDGTNTWLLRDDPSRRAAVVIDPGPDDEAHLRAVLDAAGSVPLILLTHGHADHSAGAGRLAELTGAPVLALDPAHRYGGQGLAEGAVLDGVGVRMEVWATPGHTADSLCFVLPSLFGASAEPAAVLTGDSILGRGTTVVAHPDGVLADYLYSLRRLAELTGVAVLPGHGSELADAGAAAQAYLSHREQRLAQVRAALGAGDGTAEEIVRRVYADVDRALWPAAELSVRAQLAYLRATEG
ncbi:MBL fold metallo-hydrolase [Jatrophihabitans lederbergiae]|uniref:MBL fold metallo-hydrolase n=1 Tax=Jatrophihabitans lederbergiae TaxID=3075547 RepID=A0ABU2JFC0_9ACTN|nr:MBL fold metallo-hydrolase [Jatrophihabitans sp. DSM 44399]MDT0263379.1 MBL fold metallo-hydrolase [Jatrophihabitans sp. DSM 44399]